MPASTRPQHIPNANSPALLTRLLEMVARGVRSTRGLSESLGVQPRTVQYYTQAGQWLGFLAEEGTPALTPLGLDYVYAGSRRPDVYVDAVRAHPSAAELIAHAQEGDIALEQVVAWVMTTDPELASSTARRRASSVKALLAPALTHVGRAKAPVRHRQLTLPLAVSPAQTAPAALPEANTRLPSERDRTWSPDVYRFLLLALFDYGEVTLGHVRALLDRAGAQEVPIGGYVDMALSRGDASRRGEALVLSDDAILRRGLVSSVNSIILSDRGYRAYLADAIEAASGDRAAEIRRDGAAHRYAGWDRRLFGEALKPETALQDLEEVLLDRSLASFPVAERSHVDRAPAPEPFLDVWDRPNLMVACPPYLGQLQGGLAAVNRILRRARRGENVLLPDLGHRPGLVHGGILHPGEPLPRSVPDTRSLRQRVLMCAPYPALIAAILLVHRQRPDGFRLVRAAEGWNVWAGRQVLGSLLDVLDGFGAHRGWAVARRASGGLQSDVLMLALEALGIAYVSNKQAVLDEHFFAQLRDQPEELELLELLQPMAAALESHLESL